MHQSSKLKSVLLIDDNGADNYVHRLHLESTGLIDSIHEFLYADEAIDFLKSHLDQDIDLIFLDLELPRMNGIEFLEAYRSLSINKRAKIVILATHPSPHILAQLEQFPEVLTRCVKPLTEAGAEDIIGAVLESNQNSERIASALIS
ncbi:MAG: response regulator [Thermosynechococcaceae cyanobacterium]